MLSNLTISIKNFNSYLDSGEITLDGKIILSGIDANGISNGSGKSTILKALGLFLTDEYKDYTKSDIKTLTNVNTKRGGYIDITIKCNIDNVPFEANLNGKDYFKLTADEYMLNKFRQELAGSIMNQGLVDNIADFEKRSELDNYIDRFYNTKEIVTKLKDFENTTVSKINESLNKAKEDYNNKVNKVNLLNGKISSLKDYIERYSQFEALDIKMLETEVLTTQKELNSLTKDYNSEKNKYYSIINSLQLKLNESANQVNISRQKDEFITTQTNKLRLEYLNKIGDYINYAVKQYNNKKLEEKPDSVVSIEDLDSINSYYSKEWQYGTTYKQIISEVRNTYNKVENLCNFIKPIKISFVPLGNEEDSEYYITYDNNLKLKGRIPEDLELDFKHIQLGKVDTSYYDKQLKDFNVKELTEQLEDAKSKYNTLLEEEVKYTKLSSKYNTLKSQIDNYNALVSFKKDLEYAESELAICNTDMILAEQKVNRFEFNSNELHKIIDSVCKFSGEELRSEFGTKLARISTILLEDIFGMKGTITLDSNGTKTSFKFNEGIGDLSFKVLSGGQLQKIKICINLAMLLFFYKDRQYIFLDEVFQNLDEPSKQRLIQYIVKELKIKNVLLIQHDNLKFEGFRDLIVYRGKDLNSIVKEC